MRRDAGDYEGRDRPGGNEVISREREPGVLTGRSGAEMEDIGGRQLVARPKRAAFVAGTRLEEGGVNRLLDHHQLRGHFRAEPSRDFTGGGAGYRYNRRAPARRPGEHEPLVAVIPVGRGGVISAAEHEDVVEGEDGGPGRAQGKDVRRGVEDVSAGAPHGAR